MGLLLQIGAEHRAAIKAIDEVSLTLKEQKGILSSLQKQYAALSTEQARGKVGKELAADIRIAKDEIKRLETTATGSFGAVGSAATKGFSVVRNLAYVLPGIGIAGIFSLAAEGVSKLVVGLSSLGSSLTRVKAEQDALNGAFKSDSYQKAVTDVNSLTINIDLAKKGFLSKKDVLKQYNDTLGESLGKVKSLDEAEQLLTKNGPAYIQMMLLKAAANVALQKAAEIATEVEKNRLTRTPEEQTDVRRGAFLNATKEELAEINKLTADYKEAFLKQDKALMASIQARQDSLVTELRERGVDKTLKKELSTFKDIANQFQKEAAKISQEFGIDFFGFKEVKLPKEKIQKEIDFIALATRLHLNLKTVVNLEPVFDFERFKQVLLNKIPPTLGEQVSVEIAKKNRDLADKFGPDKNKIVVDTDIRINAKTDEAEKDAERQLERLNQSIRDLATESFSSIGESLGTALAGGDLKSVFQGFGNTIGEGLQAIGKQLIAIGVKAILAKNALKALFTNPALSIAAGVALVAAGAALKSSLNGGLPRRATGGPVAAGQSIIVGERGQEVFQPSVSGRIIPNNQLGGIQGAASQIVRVELAGAIRGRDIRLLIARELKYQQANV